MYTCDYVHKCGEKLISLNSFSFIALCEMCKMRESPANTDVTNTSRFKSWKHDKKKWILSRQVCNRILDQHKKDQTRHWQDRFLLCVFFGISCLLFYAFCLNIFSPFFLPLPFSLFLFILLFVQSTLSWNNSAQCIPSSKKEAWPKICGCNRNLQ